MGRAGRSGGSSRSSGSRSSSRSSGGHRISSSRAGSSSDSSSSYRSSYSSIGRRNNNRNYTNINVGNYGESYPTTYGRTNTSSPISGLVTFMFVMIIITVFMMSLILPKPGLSSTRNREKINSNVPYNAKCIIDEIYWFDSSTQTGTKLKEFYDKTGIQPYIVLKDYDKSLKTDEDKLSYAETWYEENIKDESTFLFMYFAEQDVDNDVGFMCYVSGYQCDSVMDSEAVDILWNYIDSYWYSDMSTDDLFIEAFCDTANTIMTKSRTLADVAWLFGIIVLVCASGCIIIVIITKKRKAEKERAAETERILNTPMQDLATTSKNDDLVNKYN